MKEYRNYLFDADGTLFDTVELIYRSYVYTCQKYNGIDVDRELVIKSMGLPLYKQIGLFLGELPEQKMNQILKEYKEHQLTIYREHLVIYPGVEKTLRNLNTLDKRLAVVTSRKQETAFIYLKHVGIFDYFDVIVTPELTKRHKPDPAPAMKALELVKGAVDDSLFIGDAEFDMLCGKSAGVDTAFAAWGPNESTELNSTPTFVLDEITDLLIF